MSKPKDLIVAARFSPPVMERIGWVSNSLGLSASKWLQGLATAELERVEAKIRAAMPGQVQEQGPPTASPAVQLPGHGGVASSSSSTEGETGDRTRGAAANVPNDIVRPAAFLTDKSGQPVAGIPAFLPPPTVPAWRHQPPKPPAWNSAMAGPAVVVTGTGNGGPKNQGGQQASATEPAPSGIVMPTPVKKFECQECKDEGAGILKECICGRYKDQQGRVQRTPDHMDGPRDWGHAFALMEGMEVVERTEKFFEWSQGRTLPTQWKDMVRDAKISWLNLTWPLA